MLFSTLQVRCLPSMSAYKSVTSGGREIVRSSTAWLTMTYSLLMETASPIVAVVMLVSMRAALAIGTRSTAMSTSPHFMRVLYLFCL